jgi:hypothetical protein
MKKWMVAASCLLLLTAVIVPDVGADGTWFAGVKYWDAEWDSGILDWFEKDLATSFLQSRGQFTAHRNPGDGYLAGPLIGYQTANGKWSFSAAPMVVSSFTQTWSGQSGAMALDGDVDLERIDVDLAANYTLSDRYKLFAGLKYQDMEMDFVLSYDPGGTPLVDTYKVSSTAYIPTIGAAGVFPLGSKVVASAQGGLLYALTDLTITNAAGQTDDIWPHPGLGLNLEGNFTYQPLNDLLLQLGYRYQVFTIEARGPGRDDIVKSYDITHGLTLTAVYVF